VVVVVVGVVVVVSGVVVVSSGVGVVVVGGWSGEQPSPGRDGDGPRQ
jgi:hypothetical protein